MCRRINVYVFDYTFMYICYTMKSSYHLLSYETLWSVSKITITYNYFLYLVFCNNFRN